MAYMKVVGAGWRCSNGLGGIFRGWRIGVNMLSHNICPQTLTSDELQVAENVLQSLSQCSPKQDIEVDEIVLKKRDWNKYSRRTGLLATKLGMTQLWTKDGNSVPVTLLQIVDNEVVRVRTRDKEGYFALQIGAINHPKLKNIIKPILGQYTSVGIVPKRFLQEFRVTSDALLPHGTLLNACHYVPGQFIDVSATSIGKGFQGVMKRHGMKGMPASHGVTKSHRKMGATGGGQDPGRIWPGKKMPGRMGGKKITQQCLKVYRINYKYGVIYVHGPVPGHTNTIVRLTDARRKPPPFQAPFPGYISSEEDHMITEEMYSDDIQGPHEQTIVFPDKRKLQG